MDNLALVERMPSPEKRDYRNVGILVEKVENGASRGIRKKLLRNYIPGRFCLVPLLQFLTC
jgi:hypothetical protein